MLMVFGNFEPPSCSHTKKVHCVDNVCFSKRKSAAPCDLSNIFSLTSGQVVYLVKECTKPYSMKYNILQSSPSSLPAATRVSAQNPDDTNIRRIHELVWSLIRRETRTRPVTTTLHHLHVQDHDRSHPRPRNPERLVICQRLVSRTWEGTKVSGDYTSSLNTVCEQYGIKVNISKTETGKVCRTPGSLSIGINNIKLKQVIEFKYLGSIFTKDGRLSREIGTNCRRLTTSCSLPTCLDLKPTQNPNWDQSWTGQLHLHSHIYLPVSNSDPDKGSWMQNHGLRDPMLIARGKLLTKADETRPVEPTSAKGWRQQRSAINAPSHVHGIHVFPMFSPVGLDLKDFWPAMAIDRETLSIAQFLRLIDRDGIG